VKRQRFEELAQAYGGDIARWPAKVREEASLLAAAEPEFTRAVLSAEDRLDATLDELPRAVAPATLFESIVASAPPLSRRNPWRLWIAPAGLGAGLTAVAVMGVMLGAQLGGSHSAEATATAELDVSAVSEIG
jgi:hypothetical protein